MSQSKGQGGVERVFLGWTRPVIETAAAWLIDRHAGALGGVLVVVPGGRAMRLLTAGLVDAAEERGVPLVPPSIITPGEVPAALTGAVWPPPAGPMAQRTAWRRVLAGLSAEDRSTLAPARRGDERADWTGGLAPMIERLHRELLGENLMFGEVRERAADIPAVADDQRWDVLDRLQRAYGQELEAAGLADDLLRAVMLIRGGEAGFGDGAGGRIVMVGVAELPALARAALTAITSRGGGCATLIAAPEDRAGMFDGLGCIVSDAWRAAEIAIDDEHIAVVDRPVDQAQRVFQVLDDVCASDGGCAAHEVVIGVMDEQVGFALKRLEARSETVAFHDAAGEAFERTRIGRLLALIYGFIETRALSDLRDLVSHPDIVRWLGAEAPGAAPDGWRRAVHKVLCAGYRDDCGDVEGADERVRTLIGAVSTLLGPAGGRAPLRLSEFAGAMLDAMRTVFEGVQLRDRDDDESRVIRALRATRDALLEMAGLANYPALDEIVPPAKAMSLLMDGLSGNAVPFPTRDEAIEMLGWLELPFDPADRVIVTGFNDGLIPSNSSPDPFLPDGLRARLGLACDARRYARDAFILSGLLARCRRLDLVIGRRSAESDPLRPSRLLFACDDAEAVTRMGRFAEPDATDRVRITVPDRTPPAAKTGFRSMPYIEVEPVTAMSVTSFGQYLASPYRFYLERVLGLKEPDEAGGEMDPLDFGSLLHEMVRDFGRGPAAASHDASEISDWLEQHTRAAFDARFGMDPPATIALQMRVVLARLRAFARVQAERADAGWVIVATEWAPPESDGVPWLVDDAPMLLKGRIDRIDRHEGTGAIALLDYKSGEKPADPDKNHRNRAGWFDLQLPLYRRIAGEWGIDADDDAGVPQLGYITLASAADETKFRFAGWSADELRAADETARDVIRRVRRGEFLDLGSSPPGEGVLAAICGTSFLGADLADGEAEGAGPRGGEP